MDIQKFINIVYRNKCLWDQSEPSYHLRDQQRMTWRDISKEMGISVDELKRKWRGLRDTFGKELRKHYNKTGQAAASEPDSNWIYFKQLLFLRSIMSRRDLKNSVADTCDISYEEESGYTNNYTPYPVQSSEDSSKELKFLLKKKSKRSIADTSEIYYEEESGNANTPLQVHHSELSEETPEEIKSPLKKKVKKWQMNKIDSRLLEIEEEKLKYFLRSANDPDAQFLMSLLPFLNDVPKDRKLMVRAKLQQVFIDEQNVTTILPD